MLMSWLCRRVESRNRNNKMRNSSLKRILRAEGLETRAVPAATLPPESLAPGGVIAASIPVSEPKPVEPSGDAAFADPEPGGEVAVIPEEKLPPIEEQPGDEVTILPWLGDDPKVDEGISEGVEVKGDETPPETEVISDDAGIPRDG